MGMKEGAEVLKQAMGDRKPAEVAELIGMDKSKLHRLSIGIVEPDASDLARLAAIFPNGDINPLVRAYGI